MILTQKRPQITRPTDQFYALYVYKEYTNTDLSATEFRDAISLRYNGPLPANCDGCGAAPSLEHALDCKKGGLVTQRHNEVRDVIGDLASVVYKEVVKVPVVQEANDAEGVPSLIAIRGVWQPQTVALFDVDTDAPSHSKRVVTAALSLQLRKKRRNTQKQHAALRRASFTRLVVSVDGVLVEKQIFCGTPC